MRAVPGSLVISACCLAAWIVCDVEAGARVLMLSLVAAPLVDWLWRKTSRPKLISSSRLHSSNTATSPHTVVLSVWLLLQLGLISWALHAVSMRAVQGVQLMELMLFVGIANGIFGMSVAHELLHRTGRTARIVADALLLTALYGHFRVSHLNAHHRLVATPADPATPIVGETLYSFFGRSIVDGFALSLQIETQRLAALGSRAYALRNFVVRSTFASVTIFAMIYAFFGAAAAGLFVGQALIAIYTLEALNYVQHYGLLRPDGIGMELTAEGSLAWDCDGPFTNWLLLDLGAHNEHHGEPKSATGSNVPTNPAQRLPGSYILMIAVASFPPLWRAIMDRRVTLQRTTGERRRYGKT